MGGQLPPVYSTGMDAYHLWPTSTQSMTTSSQWDASTKRVESQESNWVGYNPLQEDDSVQTTGRQSSPTIESK